MFKEINNIKKSAEAIRKKGRSGDTILAHINPEEANLLKMFGGSGDKNPNTGLPEFKRRGFFRKILHYAPRVIGTVGGAMIGGPAGAVIGGGIGGSMERGSGNKMKGFASGAGTGAMYAAAAPWAANGMGFSPNSMIGNMAGLNHPSLLGQFGINGAPMSGGGLGLFGNGAGNIGLMQRGGFLKNGLGGLANMFGHQERGETGEDDYAPSVINSSHIDEGYGGHESDYMAPMRNGLPNNSMPTLFGLGGGYNNGFGGLGAAASGFLKKKKAKKTRNDGRERFE